MIIGIDIGGTTTDAVALKNGDMVSLVSVEAGDPITAAAGALGKLVEQIGASLSDIKVIAATGVGSGSLGDSLLGIRVRKIDEFTAIGTAGTALTGLSRAIVVSMGTGTALVQVDGKDIRHCTISVLTRKAQGGHLGTVDLTVGDIAGGPIDGLPASATASNFGKVSDDATDEDKALALVNLVCQTIGVVAVSAARGCGYTDIVLTGKLTAIPQAERILEGVGNLFSMKFHTPEFAAYATAIGAAQFVHNEDEAHD
jgi:type II pantothenate kinase